jgi:SPP1 gp7 family putative phage head morphogenesis protein
MPQKPDLSYAIGLAPEKAVEYFASKGHRFSWDWKDTWEQAHAKAFTVAKAMRMDVLQDLKDGVRKAIADGITERQFIEELTPKLQAKGWWGKKLVGDGEGGAKEVQLGSPRRLKTIYRTNLQSAYMGGRWNDMWENREERPYWMYVAVMDARTRPTHAALNGLVFTADDPFWNTHYPPLAFNCRCRVRALSQDRLDAKGLTVQSSEGNLINEDVQVSKATGEMKTVTVYTNPKTDASTAPDPGFNFNQGKAAWQPDLEKYDYDVAKQYLEGAVTGPDFTRFFKGEIGGTFPVAVLDDPYMKAIGSKSRVVLFSDQTLSKNMTAHPEFALADYQRLPVLLEQAQLVVQDGDQTFVFLRVDEKYFFGAIKTTGDGARNYLTSFRPARESDITTIRRKGKVIKDEL